MLTISNLSANFEKQTILQNINLQITPGSVHILTGQNGSGKTTLTQLLVGKRDLEISGSIDFCNQDLLKLSPEEISKLGIWSSFQNPIEIEGLPVATFFKEFLQIHKQDLNTSQMLSDLKYYLNMFELSQDFLKKDFNFNFSGGEKKKMELIQLFMLKPKLAILDEIDSGLDIKSIKTMSTLLINDFLKNQPEASLLIITHNPELKNLLPMAVLHNLEKGELI